MSENNFPIEAQIEEALAAAKARNITDIYFVGCGASMAIMWPNQYAVDRLSKNLTGHVLNAVEFVTRNPARLGANSLVLFSSMSGNTWETVAAATFARESGALTIGTTNGPGSPLDEAVEYSVYYEFKPETFEISHMSAVIAKLTFSLIIENDNSEIATKVLEALPQVPAVVHKAIESHKDRILSFAESHKRDQSLYLLGSGANYSIAYSFAYCLFQEMLWMHSGAIHSNEYFHGPFELTDFDLPIVIMRSIGPTKEMDDRAIAFAQKHSQKVTVLDAEELGMGAFSSDIVDYLEHMLFGPLVRNYSNRLAFTRGHPLTVRRYMWQIDY